MNKFLLAFFASVTLIANAQEHRLTEVDYAHAESFLSDHTASYIDHNRVIPNWLPNDCFWYRILTEKGSSFVLVDPAKGSRSAVFDHQKLAEALSAVTGNHYEASRLPFSSFSFLGNGKSISFRVNNKQWLCDLQNYQVKPAADQQLLRKEGKDQLSKDKDKNEVLSPNGKLAVFIKDDNLWVRDIVTNKQVQLTFDGIQDFGYATDNAGWRGSDRPIIRWSPDSKKIATFKQDQRNVNNMYLVTTNVGAPTLKSWKYPLPGDVNIIKIHRVIINVDNATVIPLKVQADPHRATLSDDISSSGTFDDVDWSSNSLQLAFVSTSRDHKHEKVRIADATTGEIREVFEEVVATQYESGWGSINWRYLSKSNEFIWFSERDNWGHLYLYDALTGKLKNQITKGEWIVKNLLKVDEEKRVLYFIANGLQNENPYFSQLCQIDFDGKNFKVLTPEEGNHKITLSPSGKYFMDSYSKPDLPPVTVFRKLNGNLVIPLEKTDVSRLIAKGWKPVTPIKVKAANGKTDLYGLMFTPTHLDPKKKYPIVDYIYPGPQGGSVGSWSFAASRGDHQALAELGFVVVLIEGTSNPLRSKSFHDMSYGNMAENTLPDQIAGIRQLAQRYTYIDTTRVGIWGHSGGGFATAAAMFRYPDFFKVGISESGNHDNRNYEDDWGERYNGLVTAADYEAQANQNYAKNLKGKLMLVHGLMDNNVPPYNTMLVVEALEKANKDYDLVIFPNSAHGYGVYSPYMMRRRWDYFVKNLLKAEPPHEYRLKTVSDPRNTFE